MRTPGSPAVCPGPQGSGLGAHPSSSSGPGIGGAGATRVLGTADAVEAVRHGFVQAAPGHRRPPDRIRNRRGPPAPAPEAKRSGSRRQAHPLRQDVDDGRAERLGRRIPAAAPPWAH
ncbi:hypothetical protein [Streptomyces sp. NBC_01334]|uniref:hypothetical protein n=1 Tax=Streptomyces sp. NBC_01334 TaxID=2903827 RepID=UPI002E132D58|nr:hypothetical protein OG736_00520 [Streptomyces sp. NBC_01334]WSN45193.1 hypothetical protein OG736_44015 [Streptomyces sp. NBC_01334]